LFLIEGLDYTVSKSNNKTKITFIGSVLQGQPEAFESGDSIRVSYFKDVRGTL
jgi:hypothetical protein